MLHPWDSLSLNDPVCSPATDSADLSRNLALKRFHLRVDRPDDLNYVLVPLCETLSTIPSPTFSEFALKLEGCSIEIHFFRLVSGDMAWGREWDLIDRQLDDMVRVAGRDIRLVLQVGAGGGVWTPRLVELVGGVFPLMHARGLMSVEAAKP